MNLYDRYCLWQVVDKPARGGIYLSGSGAGADFRQVIVDRGLEFPLYWVSGMFTATLTTWAPESKRG